MLLYQKWVWLPRGHLVTGFLDSGISAVMGPASWATVKIKKSPIFRQEIGKLLFRLYFGEGLYRGSGFQRQFSHSSGQKFGKIIHRENFQLDPDRMCFPKKFFPEPKYKFCGWISLHGGYIF